MSVDLEFARHYAQMNQFLYEGKAPNVKEMTEQALEAGRVDLSEGLRDPTSSDRLIGEERLRQDVFLSFPTTLGSTTC